MTDLSAGFEPENPQGAGHDHPLLLVIRRRDALEALQPLHGGLAPLGLVRHHASDRPPEDLARGPEVERASQGLDVAPQPQELQVLELVAVEVAGHVDALAADDHHLVAVQDELGHDRGQTAHQVAAAVDHHGFRAESWHVCSRDDRTGKGSAAVDGRLSE